MVDSERMLIKWKETIRLETMMLVAQITQLLEKMDGRRLRLVLAYVQRLYSTG
jgi:hypothetical protein|nr:MAG TPA: hypothetical protein [Caudoviricetes sp.]